MKIVRLFWTAGVLCLVWMSAGAELLNPVTAWRFQTNGPVRGGVIADGENIYFGSADGNLYAVQKKTGELRWKYQTTGAIASTPALLNNVLVICSRDNFVYAIQAATGKLIWKFQMQPEVKFEMGWDYHMASPVISGKQVFVGSGDSYLYSLSLEQGKPAWKFKTNGRIRATPLVINETIYQPSNDGMVYAINTKNGELSWKFETKGATLDGKKFGYDRTSIFSSPRLADSLLIFGSRDGATYCVNIHTHKKKWHFFYDGTWAMSAPVIDEGVAFIGWSTNFNFSAFDIQTGKEKWVFKAKGVHYANPVIENKVLYTVSADQKMYCLDKQTGKVIWEYRTGGSLFSSPWIGPEGIFVGSDDGAVYCLKEGNKPMLAVYDPVPRNSQFRGTFSMEPKITPYLKDRGFDHLDSAKLQTFLTARIADKLPSVIVFSYQYIPDNILGEDPSQGLVRQYLNAGGKIIWFGDVPKRFPLNDKGRIASVDNTLGSKLLGVKVDDEMESGNFYCKPTQEGLNWGLPLWLTSTYATVAPEGIVPLAVNEFGRTAIWLKKFSEAPGSGFVSIRTWPWHTPFDEGNLALIYKVAVYGIQ